jgi:hypothetical protein
MSTEPILRVEPVTRGQIEALESAVARSHGSFALLVCGLSDVEPAKGRGVIKEGETFCLWTTQNHRVTISTPMDGGLLVSCSKSPDPEFEQTRHLLK